MDISEKDFNALVLAVTEKVLLRMPEVIGNLMMNHAEVNKLTKDFYGKNPSFKNDPVSVKSVISALEQDNAGMKYDKILELSEPMIRERMITVKSLNIKDLPKKEELDLSFDNSNGVL